MTARLDVAFCDKLCSCLTRTHRRSDRQVGGADRWLALDRTGCSVSGHSRNPTTWPTPW